MRILAAALAFLAWMGVSQTVAQPTVTDLCARATMTAAVGPIAAETFSYGGVDRYYCTYTSSLITTGTRQPLVIALHGGDGDASQFMEDACRIIEHAEAIGWIESSARLAAGRPASCPRAGPRPGQAPASQR